VVAYMILGVQFNSFVHPFTVLMAVPFGVTGAAGHLDISAVDTLNLMSMIGMVLLAGLLTLSAPWLMRVPVLHGALSALGCGSLPG